MSAGPFLLILLLSCSVPAAARAQGPGVELRPGPSHLLWQRPSSPAAEPAQEPLGGLLGRGDLDYRYTGFFVGTALGLGLAALTFVVCADTDSGCDSSRALPFAVLMIGVSGLSGAVIGGFVPKDSVP